MQGRRRFRFQISFPATRLPTATNPHTNRMARTIDLGVGARLVVPAAAELDDVRVRGLLLLRLLARLLIPAGRQEVLHLCFIKGMVVA